MLQSSHSKKLIRAKNSHPNSGVTLIEVLLALAITGFLIAAATSFVVYISNIWAERSQRNFFEDHVDGVTEFINATLQLAGASIQINDNKNSSEQQKNGVEMMIQGTAEITPQQNNASIPVQKKDTIKNLRYDADSKGLMTNETSLRNRDSNPILWKRLPGSAKYQEPILQY